MLEYYTPLINIVSPIKGIYTAKGLGVALEKSVPSDTQRKCLTWRMTSFMTSCALTILLIWNPARLLNSKKSLLLLVLCRYVPKTILMAALFPVHVGTSWKQDSVTGR